VYIDSSRRRGSDESAAERCRLATLVERLGEQQLGRSLGGGWTVAVALAHLAFWDRRALLLLDRWEGGGRPPPEESQWSGDDVINDALLAEWQALSPPEAARLAIEAARAVDRGVESLDASTVEEIVAHGESWLVRRALHRCEHLDQIDRAI
jgi:hypothetical protein